MVKLYIIRGHFRGMQGRYDVSKLLNIFFVRALAKRLQSQKIVVKPPYAKAIAFTAEEGSRQLQESLNGGYISGSQLVEVNDFVLGQAGQKAEEDIWNETVDILGNLDPRVGSIVQEHLSQA
ncbi:hypothetical protein BD779DRAFT_1522202 [Infundibulicybe gibba]|nr:hypothetical protein BD779DRAFT_1522202 [Infundibulicybe gibba]